MKAPLDIEMSNGLHLRRFQPDDLPEVKQLHVAALEAIDAYMPHRSQADLDDIEGVYLNNGGEFLVSPLNHEIVVMGGFKRVSDNVVDLKRMRVTPSLQGQGIGRELLGILEGLAIETGYQTMTLDTSVKQAAALRLYKTSGYSEIRRETEGWPTELIFFKKQLQ